LLLKCDGKAIASENDILETLVESAIDARDQCPVGAIVVE